MDNIVIYESYMQKELVGDINEMNYTITILVWNLLIGNLLIGIWDSILICMFLLVVKWIIKILF